MIRASVLVVVLSAGASTMAAQATAPVPMAVERRLADEAGLHVGDTVGFSIAVRAASTAARIVAIYEPRADPATIMRRDYHVRLHLADLAALLGDPDRVDRMGIVLHPGVDADRAAAILNWNAFGYDVAPSRTIAAQSSTTFLVVSRFHRAIAIISVLASTVFLLCLMLLKVDERRRDVAVLRFTGISRRTIFISLLLEAAFVSIAGSLIGVGLALVAGTIVNSHYQHAYATTLIFSEVTPATLVFAVALSIGLGLGAGALAAWRLVRVAPLELWSRAA